MRGSAQIGDLTAYNFRIKTPIAINDPAAGILAAGYSNA